MMIGKRLLILFAFYACSFEIMGQCDQNYAWAKWANFNGSNATGTILVDGKSVNVTMSANYSFSSTSEIYFFSNSFTSFSGYSGIANSTVPKTTWSVGTGGKTTMCFSEPVTNPVLLLSSLGRLTIPVTLSFSESYVPIFDGGGMNFENNYSISGSEGNAILLFPGTFTCLTINSTTPEDYTNITWGLQPPAFPVSISGNAKGCSEVTLTASGGKTYQWNGGDSPDKGTNTFRASGTYTVTATDNNGCKSIALKNIIIFSDQNVTNINQTICYGQDFQGYKKAGSYVDTLKTKDGCDSIRIINLRVIDLPKIELGDARRSCKGDIPEIVPDINGNGAYNFTWSSGETTRTIKPAKSGTYKLTISEESCSVSDSVDVIFNEPPDLQFDDNICKDDPIEAGNESDSLSYLWEHSDETSRVISVQHGGQYKVTITNPSGCSVVKIIEVSEDCMPRIYAPDIFTPNDDGINDVFQIYTSVKASLKLSIYNRWGNLIYTETGNNPKWNGLKSSDPPEKFPFGTYVYLISYNDPFNNKPVFKRGSIILMK